MLGQSACDCPPCISTIFSPDWTKVPARMMGSAPGISQGIVTDWCANIVSSCCRVITVIPSSSFDNTAFSLSRGSACSRCARNTPEVCGRNVVNCVALESSSFRIYPGMIATLVRLTCGGFLLHHLQLSARALRIQCPRSLPG